MSNDRPDTERVATIRGKHVLVAEDDPPVRRLVRTILETHGITVHEARDGREAEGIARREPVDLVISDLWMPVANGVELVEALNAMDCPAEVIVLSAHVTSATAEKLRTLGVFRTLKKPASTAALLEAVRAGMASDRAERLGRRSAAGEGPSDTRSVRPPVLVADDDDSVRGLIRSILTEAGHRVEEARDGQEAIEKAAAHGARLVLMDLNMPRMSGPEAVRALHRASRDCFIVCLTGECTKREIDAALGAGALCCIRKPFDPRELLAEVQRIELISAHRRCSAGRERMGFSSCAPRTAEQSRFARRMLVAGLVAVLVAALAVPVIAGWFASARRSVNAASARGSERRESSTPSRRATGTSSCRPCAIIS